MLVFSNTIYVTYPSALQNCHECWTQSQSGHHKVKIIIDCVKRTIWYCIAQQGELQFFLSLILFWTTYCTWVFHYEKWSIRVYWKNSIGFHMTQANQLLWTEHSVHSIMYKNCFITVCFIYFMLQLFNLHRDQIGWLRQPWIMHKWLWLASADSETFWFLVIMYN